MKLKMSVCMLMLAYIVAAGDVLVLKNGKVLRLPGSYELKGQFVVFETETGVLTQLPVKMVDLEKSKLVTEQEEAKRLAAIEAAKKPPEVKKDVTMAEIAAYVESKRMPDEVIPKDVALSDEKLDKYGVNNPRPTDTEAPFVAPTGDVMTPDQAMAESKKFGEAYNALMKDMSSLDKQIEVTETLVETAANNVAFGDDPTEGSYNQMEYYEKQLEDLRNKKAEKEDELKSLERNARQAGVKNFKRYKGDN